MTHDRSILHRHLRRGGIFKYRRAKAGGLPRRGRVHGVVKENVRALSVMSTSTSRKDEAYCGGEAF